MRLLLLLLGPLLAVVPRTASAASGRHLGHLLAEVGTGLTLGAGEGGTPTAGATGSVTLGVGGKLAGAPPRLFLVAGLDRSTWGATSVDRFGAASVRRAAGTWTVGGRAVFPLWSRRWRAVAQLGLGASSVEARGRREGLPPVHTKESHGTMLGALGLQWRLHPHLSLGLRADRSWSLDDGADLAAAAAGLGEEGAGRGRVGLGLTLTGHL